MSRVSEKDLEYWANTDPSQLTPKCLPQVARELRAAREAMDKIKAITAHSSVCVCQLCGVLAAYDSLEDGE